MIGLAIHTTSPELGLALTNLALTHGEGRERYQVWPLGRDLTTYLHGCLSDFLGDYTWQDLAFLAVAKGPGGFTGTRVGVVVARTLAQQLSIPLFGISSLAAIAQQYYVSSHETSEPPPQVAVAMQAQRGEVFGAIYQYMPPEQHLPPELGMLLQEAVRSQAEWEALLKAWPHPYHLITAENGLAASVTGVLSLAKGSWEAGDRPDWRSVLPFYGQHPVH